MSRTNPYPVLSLFSGAGGLDIGFEQAGFRPLLALDNDPEAVSTYNWNRRDNRCARAADLSQVDAQSILKWWEERAEGVPPAGIIGGPACQAFSASNVHQLEDDPRAKLPLAYADILKAFNDRQDIAGTNSSIGFSESGRVFRVNDRRGQLYRGALGTTTRGQQQLENQWVDERFHGQPGDPFEGMTFVPAQPVESIALAAPKTTDVLRIRPTTVHDGLSLDPLLSSGAVKAAYYSAAFILRSVIAERLDTDPEEIDVSNVRQVELPDGTKAGEAVLNDHLPNGAGFVAWVWDHWQEMLETTVRLDAPANTFIGALVSETHRTSCNSSGYDCLRQYRNMSYHGLLDWRLGLSLLRCLQSRDFVAGLDGSFELPDLEGWLPFATELRDSFCSSFGCRTRDFGPLPGFNAGNQQVVIVHPLWNVCHPTGILAEARSEADPRPVRFLDTFNLLTQVYHRLERDITE